MSEKQEEFKELTGLRQIYYTLLVRLFWKEPEPEFIASLNSELASRAQAAGQLHPLMGDGWREIGEFLAHHQPDEVVAEYTRMFVGPFQPQVSPYESRYLTGALFKEPLVKVREFMARTGMAKDESQDFPEPEDMLAFELEIMNWLVTKELDAKNAKEARKWVERQAEFFKTHLQVWAPECAKDITEAENAVFYHGVGLLLQGFLELEILNFHDIGPEQVATLEEARRHYGKMRTFKGEVYDPDPVGDPPSKIEN